MRYIQFSPAEVVQALREFLRRRGQNFPPGTVTEAAPVGEVEEEIVRYRMVITGSPIPQIGNAPPREPDKHEIVVPAETLKAALILYCRDLKIPLPMAPYKSLRYVAPQVCLLMTMAGGPLDPGGSVVGVAVSPVPTPAMGA
jgi:hypothetical protein